MPPSSQQPADISDSFESSPLFFFLLVRLAASVATAAERYALHATIQEAHRIASDSLHAQMGLSFVGSTILLMGCAHLARYSQARRRSMQRIPAARRSRTPTRRRAPVQPRPRSKPAPQPFLSVMPGGELQLAIMTSTPAGAAVKPPEAESAAESSAEAPMPSAQPPPPQPDGESGDGGTVPAASEESHLAAAGTTGHAAADIETGHGQHPSELT